MAYEGTFIQCLEVAAQRIYECRDCMVILYQKTDGGLWYCRAYPSRNVIASQVEVGQWFRYIGLDYEMMRSLLIWMAQNILKGAN